MRGLSSWQERVYGRAVDPDDTTNLMVVADNGYGKSYLLERIQKNRYAPKVDGTFNSVKDLREKFESAEDLLLMDEGGAFSHYLELVQIAEANPDVQFIIATLPDCPSMRMVESRFEVVEGNERPAST